MLGLLTHCYRLQRSSICLCLLTLVFTLQQSHRALFLLSTWYSLLKGWWTLQTPSVSVLWQQMVTGPSLETQGSDSQVVAFRLPCGLQSESSSLAWGVGPENLGPKGQELLDWKEMRVFRNDPSPHPQGLLSPQARSGSHRDPQMLSGTRVNRCVYPHLPILFPAPLLLRKQHGSQVPGKCALRPLQVQVPPGSADGGHPRGQDLLLQSPAANWRLFPGRGEGPSCVGQQGGTGWLFEAKIPGPG